MIIDIINNKGGTGKTTTCVNLAAALAGSGHSVLVIDLDSQASASYSLGTANNALSPSIADALFDDTELATIIRNTGIPNLCLVTGSMDLAHSDLVLADINGWESLLGGRLDPVRNDFDFILLDSPPSLSTIFINALVASDYYIVPVTPEYLALEGFINLMRIVSEIKMNMSVRVELLGILFTMVNPTLKVNRKITREIIRLVSEEYGDRVFSTKIVRSIMLSEAPAEGSTIFEYAPRSVGARDYSMLAGEVVSRCSEAVCAPG